MTATFLATATSGALFGAALAASGVYSPAVILTQMSLADFQMLKVFLTATATSAIAIAGAKGLQVAACKPRPASSLGWVHRYDANVIGGLLQGFGMALTGSCPGTLLVQIATGIPTSYVVAGGACLGGILYSGYYRVLPKGGSTESTQRPSSPPPLTVYQKYYWNENQAILGFEVLVATIVALAVLFKPQSPDSLLSPIVAGLVIGSTQAASLVLTGNTIGVSTTYERFGQTFWWLVSPSNPGEKRPALGPLTFAAGVSAGAWALSRLVALPVPQDIGTMSPARGVLGGAMLVVGARIAGGCTSGHGISGLATLSISSFVTVASMFAGGMGLAILL